MPADKLGGTRGLHSVKHLDRFSGGSSSAMRLFLLPMARRDVVYFEDDFMGDTINLDHYAVANSTNANVFAIPATQVLGGAMVADTGATDNEATSIRGAAVWKGDHNVGMEVRMKVSPVTNYCLELGFVDTVTNAQLPAVGDVDTPVVNNGAGDAALFHIDTDQTLTTMAFVTDGSTANMNSTKTNLGTFAPTNDTYHVFTIQTAGDAVMATIDDRDDIRVNHGSTTASKIEGGTLLRPWVYVRTRHTAAVTATVDYIRIWQDRAARS